MAKRFAGDLHGYDILDKTMMAENDVPHYFQDLPVSSSCATSSQQFLLRSVTVSQLVRHAIVKTFISSSEHPTAEVARDLTLIAKVIQNIANLVQFGKKEV